MKRTMLMAVLSVGLVTGNAQVMLQDGTNVRVRLEQMISSATAEQGQTVDFLVAESIKVDEVVVIPEGARATGTVTEAHEKRRMGRAGKLDFSIDRVRAADGEWIPLRYTLQKKNGQSHVVRTGIITAGVAAVFWPAAPVMLLMKGKDIIINKGVTFDVFTDTTHALAGGRQVLGVSSRSEEPTLAPAFTQTTATITITSSIAGADIDVDGMFVGNTPTTVQLQPGSHRVTVNNGAQTWTRTIQINSGSAVSLSAAFSK